jgi:bifunctional DNase/RNase
MTDLIPVKVAALSLSNMGFVILLRSPGDKRAVPVFIGAPEAQAIAIQIEHVEVPRPLTHDLFKNVLDCFECRLKRAVISRLEQNTFYALLVLERDGVETEVDSRPSDAIALALRCGAPIFLARQVMDQAGVLLPEEGGDEKKKPTQAAAPLSPMEQLKTQLEQAVSTERYEDAAKLRDEIRRLERPHGHN